MFIYLYNIYYTCYTLHVLENMRNGSRILIMLLNSRSYTALL